MKAFYSVVDDKVYRIEQRPLLPQEMILGTPGVRSDISSEGSDKIVSQTIHINTLENPIKSNKELYNDLVKKLIREKTKDIKPLKDFYKIAIDYSIIEHGEEVERNIVFRPVKAFDAVMPLGVADNNETVYRRVKSLNSVLEFRTKDTIGYGIMQGDNGKCKYHFKVNDVTVYSDPNAETDMHPSIYNTPFGTISPVIEDLDTNNIKIYSSTDEGVEFAPIMVKYRPRTVQINIEMIYTNVIVAYNDREIADIIFSNRDHPHPGHHPHHPPVHIEDDPDNPAEEHPVPEIQEFDPLLPPPAKPGEEPDKDGYMFWWEKCEETNPNAYVVIADDTPEEEAPEHSVTVSYVIVDIPDVQPGDYVCFNETIVDMF